VERFDEQRDQLLEWLQSREPSVPVKTIETHISILAFQGDRVYKLKKAVRYPFIDLSTPERRLADCGREVALNRRLAADVYLGVEAVVDDDGRAVDHVVVMRRMPDDRRLSSLMETSDPSPCVGALAELMARFHEGAPTGGAIDAAATCDAVADLWEGELAQFPGPSARVAQLARNYLAGRRALFDARIEAHRARDGHGDLLADDVFCLPDGPRVLDCLEFDERLRFGDALADVAFLAMDLERLRRTDLAEQFLVQYRAARHEDWPSSLEHFYIAYRAQVRAKVAALSNDDAGARQRCALALDHLERGEIRLVLVSGPPATGKTTTARAIAAATRWPVVRSDVVRKELAGIEPASNAGAQMDAGIYSPAWTELTYAALCDRARDLLAHGCSVVLDASWNRPQLRALAARVATDTTSRLIALQCAAPSDVARERAARRFASHEDASDADATIAAVSAARFAPWPEARVLDTTKTEAEVTSAALSVVGRF
jgi:aminoglycoside phosphotransferase family enzyme/predicted kinase